jgi:hypothetical protein
MDNKRKNNRTEAAVMRFLTSVAGVTLRDKKKRVKISERNFRTVTVQIELKATEIMV